MEASKAHFYVPDGVFLVEGEDASSFLQGQFSQNLQHPDGSMAYGLWLNHKGKILADSFILKISDRQFFVASYFGEGELLRENLESRIIMDEVETRPPEPGWVGISVWGDAIDKTLEFTGLERPAENGFSLNGSVYAFWGRRGTDPNLEVLFGDGVDLKDMESRFEDSNIQFLSTEAVRVLALRDRYFQVGRDVQNSDLPQEVGLAEIAVSYNKGCYIGQEVMARLRSIGRPRRILECVSVTQLLEGESPWNLVTKDGSRAGELRQTLGDGTDLVGAAMIKRSFASEDFFEVEGQAGVVVRRLKGGSVD